MKKWKTIIEPKTKLFDIPLKEIWQYRNMIYMLVKRNYQVQYKQTILGPFWLILSPIISSGLLSFVFGYVGKFSSEGIPYFLFYMSANVLWSFFSGCLYGNSSVFLANTYLFGKVYFPRLVVPVANVFFETIRFGIQFVVCIFVWLFFLINGQACFMGRYLLLIPFLVLEAGIMGMAIGIIVSSLTIKYRDLSHFIGIGVQLLLYVSPVLYPIDQLPSFVQRIVLLNPVSSMIEAFRYSLTGSGSIHWGALLYSVIVTVVIFCVSLVLFNQTEKTFVDIV